MVSFKEIQASNALINDATPRIAVFVGGTSGIGKATIEALVATGSSLRIYLTGRKGSQQRVETFIHELHVTNPNAEILWVEGEVSLLAETTRICEIIKNKERYIDLLFLTTGYAPFTSRKETLEGLEISQTLSYYSRMLFVLHLLPLLNEAQAPRVISVLGGGLEPKTIELDDIDLKKPGNFNFIKAQMQYAAMNSLFLESLADENPEITFIHSWPGWVNTRNVRRGLDSDSILAWIVWLFLEPLIAIFSYSNQESGQRHLFQCTSSAFGGRGTQWMGKIGINSHGKEENGLFFVNYKCECTPNSKAVSSLRESARKKVVVHTNEILAGHM
ncbi:short chain dehydrogenase reductase family [Fusarium heterosporum]|uniref:Short chain dehydrogenase reductase family n=1 Tax=Fusarium heterosporum TaxID=42747 RepID=A0A8H5T3C6_FUSHE|nr:short chain dehydrogenase reductase family [Fusarium heterosporum]